jgi:enamine deaminase RidA (YjgF/YER057c/UK114 family)
MTEHFFSGAPWEEKIGYSRAVRMGNTIEVSGTTSVKDGSVYMPGDAFHQTMRIYEIVSSALHHFGATLNDISRVRIFVVNIDANWGQVAKAHKAVIGDSRPAMSMIGVSALIDPDLLVEVEVSAII